MGPSLPNLLATVAGNLFELKPFSGLRLLDVRIPSAFLERYEGPQFGVHGTRQLSSVFERPLIGTIIKPSVGLSPEATAATVAKLVDAGRWSSLPICRSYSRRHESYQSTER
jgi:ribulose-bisphosphate carboxylase large chain